MAIWPVWLNGWGLRYELSGCGFKSRCCHLRKSMFLKYSFFEDVPFLSISRNVLETPSLDDIFLGNFTWSNSSILIEDLIRWHKGLKCFWLITMLVKLEIKISLVSIKAILVKSVPHHILGGSVRTGCYVYNSLVHISYFLY